MGPGNEASGAAASAVKSADRALRILELLSTRTKPATLTELSRELDIPASSLHGLLRTMQRRMWLEVDDTNTRFGLGIQALLVGSSYTRADDQVARAGAVLDWLNEVTGETVHYGRLEGAHVIYLAKRESRYQLRIYSAVGKRIPAHAASLGKAILAEGTDEEAVARLQWPLARLTRNTLGTEEALLADLEMARSRGYATELEESDYGLGCVGVAVPGRAPQSDAISVAVPTARLDPERMEQLAATLLEAKRLLSGHLAVPRDVVPDGGGFLRNLE